MKITLFSEDLRECLNAAGFSDCGENDAWNYWYQRLMKSHNECADRGILTEQAENAKLRELLRAAYNCTNAGPSCLECRVVVGGCTLLSAMRELGIEVDE